MENQRSTIFGEIPHSYHLMAGAMYIGVRGLPERDIWSLCVGLGVAGKSIVLPTVAVAAPPGLGPPKTGF